MQYRIKNNIEEPDKICPTLLCCAKHIQKRTINLTHHCYTLDKILKCIEVSKEFKHIDYNLLTERVLVFKIHEEQTTRKEIHSPN